MRQPPGGVLISFETYAHVKDEVRCEERGHVQVKGIAQPVATYAVLGLKRTRNRPARRICGWSSTPTACPATSARRRRMRCAARSDCSKKAARPRHWPSNEPGRCELSIDAKKPTDIHRPHECAACRARLDSADTIAHDADRRSGNEDAAVEKTIPPDGSGPDRQSANYAAQFAAQAAAGAEGLGSRVPHGLQSANCLVSRVHFPVEIAKI